MNDNLLRLGLIGAASFLLMTAGSVYNTAPRTQVPSMIAVMITCSLFGLCLLLLAGVRHPPSWAPWSVLVAGFIDLGVRILLRIHNYGFSEQVTVDSALYSDFAGALLLRGVNPYSWDYTGAFSLYRVPYSSSTPSISSTYLNKYPYPALAFLFVIPFQMVGLPGCFSLQSVAYCAVLLLLFLTVPRQFRPIALLPVMLGRSFLPLTLSGMVDMVWIALLIGVITSWHRPVLCAALFGIAVSYKQLPWILAPFLLIRIWRENIGRSFFFTARFLIIVFLVFFLVNLPFLSWDPAAWWRCIFSALDNDLVLMGQTSLASLTQFGLASLPPSFFSIASSVILILLLFVFWQHESSLREVIWVLPGIVLWFAPRALYTYWLFLALPAVAAALIRFGAKRHSVAAYRHSRSWRLTVSICVCMLGGLFLTGIAFSLQPSPLVLRPLFPIFTTEGRAVQLSVEVSNNSLRTLHPRFSIQNLSRAYTPLPWNIMSGPRTLLAGKKSLFIISNARHDRDFFAHESIQIVATDAGGDRSLRGVSLLNPDSSFLWPESVPNPSFRYWDLHSRSPIFWAPVGSPYPPSNFSIGEHDGRVVIQFSLNAVSKGMNWGGLECWTAFPRKPFGIWLFSESDFENVPDAYGVEIDDGEHRIWFLFGPQRYTGTTPDGSYVFHRFIPSGSWTYKEIDVVAAYKQVGLPLPALRAGTYNNLDIDMRFVHFRLILAITKDEGSRPARFGPLLQKHDDVTPKILMSESFEDPASHYIRIAEMHLRMRNFDLALESYHRAFAYSTDPMTFLRMLDFLTHSNWDMTR